MPEAFPLIDVSGDPGERGRQYGRQAEARIRQLEQMLRNAEVGEAPSSPDEVVPGSKVTVCYFDDESDTDTFLLGSRQVMGLDDSVNVSVYSPQSPLGGAILGHSKGESTEYQAPNGKTIKVTILNVEPFEE